MFLHVKAQRRHGKTKIRERGLIQQNAPLIPLNILIRLHLPSFSLSRPLPSFFSLNSSLHSRLYMFFFYLSSPPPPPPPPPLLCVTLRPSPESGRSSSSLKIENKANEDNAEKTTDVQPELLQISSWLCLLEDCGVLSIWPGVKVPRLVLMIQLMNISLLEAASPPASTSLQFETARLIGAHMMSLTDDVIARGSLVLPVAALPYFQMSAIFAFDSMFKENEYFSSASF
ncbi:uncharacterized protein V6R79_003673 [Siganus canaliculatus]